MDDVNANEFLTIKSTEQQKKEGVERPVDTAFVEEQNGQLFLKAVFDVHHFKPEEVSLKVFCTFFGPSHRHFCDYIPHQVTVSDFFKASPN